MVPSSQAKVPKQEGQVDWSGFDEREFDEDLSEESVRVSDGEEAQSDGSSERSYNGVDAEAYYELKDKREDRKWEVRERLEEKVNHKETARLQEEKVEAAYQLLKGNGPKPALAKSLQSSTFELFSQHGVDFIPSFGEDTSNIKFIHDPYGFGSGYGNMLKPSSNRLFARLSHTNALGDMYGPCSPPTHADEKPIKLPDEHGMHPLYVTFVSDDYLKLSLHKYAVVLPDDDEFDAIDASGAPDTFEFVGVRKDSQEDSDMDSDGGDGYNYGYGY